MKSAYKLLLVTISLLLLSEVGLLLGMLADHWFEIVENEFTHTNFGLLRLCRSTSQSDKARCSQRGVLQFSPYAVWGLPLQEKVLDEILTLLMVSSLIGCFAFTFFAYMGLASDQIKYRWKVSGLFGFFLVGLSAILALSACAISEFYIYDVLLRDNQSIRQANSSTFCWCGAALMVITMIFAFFNIFKTPMDDSSKRYGSDYENHPVYTVTTDNSTMHTTENLYADVFVPESVTLNMDFFDLINTMPPPPTYAEASQNQGSPPGYTIGNPYAIITV